MKLVRILSAILLLLLVADIARYFVVPDVGRLVDENPAKTAFMESREAEWRRDGLIDKKIDQKWVSLDHVSQNLVKAVLIAEDDKFWQHEGFDYQAIERAIEKNILAKKFKMGGSTISQQLAKNLYLSPSKNPIRKIKEAILTWRLEKTLSKRRILELYVNVAEWGDGIFGIGQAARHYYGVSAARLTARQASRLAAILPNPILYSPKGSSRYVRNRSSIIYAIMRKRGVVVPDYREVMALTPDTTAVVDSVVIGIPENLMDQSLSSDSTTGKVSEGDGVQPAEKGESTTEVPAESGNNSTP
ncbi:monofunctional biosynthetic peptidoglycan transglycosylase [Pelodictyon phaeoclathratiforme]|jgi:monofunctional biosynthetic peptidoglycan transglycosylase|uniref:Biosynthetic peptidoglycan transglycosylase n=1 Tax=Pelodictyon phaeoclathratiforme (strain DSM 5477 / BU-1) TaxID=324925 RepID=B4SGC2_PELPB|nr:monofunctional biosynthetic peptidoglycan transglycosylase [Pelodictyon phaeoclathratiforme]ACF44858.1 monofunctional biosynthetic peptidoglycan transglycosylase [Pelodictyon phaeoclathratiforme BU-1]MBV5290555.1 monofunctional biosynthetic peptidoglycan transglycosylase [Pelodictyon phaeoclathratiforme]